MRRVVIQTVAGLAVFSLVAVGMVQLMPKPLKDSDLLVAGSVATLVALLVLFFSLISSTVKSKNIFFKKRRKQ